jgi:hypothetical protein
MINAIFDFIIAFLLFVALVQNKRFRVGYIAGGPSVGQRARFPTWLARIILSLAILLFLWAGIQSVVR